MGETQTCCTRSEANIERMVTNDTEDGLGLNPVRTGSSREDARGTRFGAFKRVTSAAQ